MHTVGLARARSDLLSSAASCSRPHPKCGRDRQYPRTGGWRQSCKGYVWSLPSGASQHVVGILPFWTLSSVLGGYLFSPHCFMGAAAPGLAELGGCSAIAKIPPGWDVIDGERVLRQRKPHCSKCLLNVPSCSISSLSVPLNVPSAFTCSCLVPSETLWRFMEEPAPRTGVLAEGGSNNSLFKRDYSLLL